ncbi:MAG TPA: mechanosensitive ion channel family protein [Candidatus Andersenbacteria bacterium]|nr:mechanosensitive ion channel family protein [Candidatus Andersenbacteria bacterium]
MAIETYWGNTLLQYAIALLIFSITVLGIIIIQRGMVMYMNRIAGKSKTVLDDAVIAMIGTIHPPFYWFASFVFATQYLTLDPLFRIIINRLFIVWLVVQGIIACQIGIDFFLSEKIRSGGKAQSAMVSGILSGLIKIGLWLTALLFILSNLGINVNSLIAGVGIGGIAIALAAQNILGDLFSSLAIFFDSPFVIGDYIVVGANSGTVQKIGIKTTRIRALSGEEISIPNKDIAAARISNLKRMKERRASLSIAVPYGTDSKILEKIPALLAQSVEGVEHAYCKSSYLVQMGTSAIMFELVYVIQDRDFDVYQTARQQIIINVVHLFAKHRIELIPPGQTIQLGA